MIVLKQVLHDLKTNSVEATWVNRTIAPATVDEAGNTVAGEVTDVQVKCHSYADVQMGMLEADIGVDATQHAGLIAAVRAEEIKRRSPPPTAQELADRFALIKAAKNAEINAGRLTANRSTFGHGGKVFACDELSRSDIDGANGMIANLGAMPAGWPGGWKAVDNTYMPIATVADWKAFYGGMFAAGNANFMRAQSLKDALAAATTAAQVAAIVW